MQSCSRLSASVIAWLIVCLSDVTPPPVVERPPRQVEQEHAAREPQHRCERSGQSGQDVTFTIDDGSAVRLTILAYDLVGDGTAIANRRVLIDAGPGTPDGMRCDVDGNLWCGWGMGDPALDGVMVFAPDGELAGIRGIAVDGTFGSYRALVNTKMTGTRLSYPLASLIVSDTARALGFYAGLLGLEQPQGRPDLGYPGAWLAVGRHLAQIRPG